MAVTEPVWAPEKGAACTVNVAAVAPVATLNCDGAVRTLLTVETEIEAPAGAGFVKVTVQEVEPPEPTLGGLQLRPETEAVATRLTDPVAELEPYRAVTVAA